MRELTSSFDDLDKRMAIFIGLGAFLFSSLLCLVRGSDFETFLIQGVLAAFVAMLVGYAYGHWLRGLVHEHSPGESTDEENVEFRSVDAEHLAEEVVSATDFPETVIEEDGVVVSNEAAPSFEMPDFSTNVSPEIILPPAPPVAPSVETSPSDSGVDLPPPSVPAGA